MIGTSVTETKRTTWSVCERERDGDGDGDNLTYLRISEDTHYFKAQAGKYRW